MKLIHTAILAIAAIIIAGMLCGIRYADKLKGYDLDRNFVEVTVTKDGAWKYRVQIKGDIRVAKLIPFDKLMK